MTLEKKAERAALAIYRDMCKGVPTEKGIKTIVKGTWAKFILKELKKA